MSSWLRKYALFEIPRDGTGGTGGTGENTGTPWHTGMDAELLGHVQSLGWDKLDPAKAATEAAKSHREAQKYIGVPKEQLLKLPKDNTNPADWDPVWQRLGAPKEAKDYDLSGVKFTDGSDVEAGFTDAMRAALYNARVPTDKARPIVDAVLKYFGDADAAEATIAESKFNEGKAKLEKSWGANKQFNALKADEGARRLGLSSDHVKAIGQVIGIDVISEALRKIGIGTSEASFHEGGNAGGPKTSEEAQARMAELNKDQAWQKRLMANDPAALAEFRALMHQISGVSPSEAA